MFVITPVPISQRIRKADNTLRAWILARYLLAPSHPAKLRVWRWMYSLAGRPKINVRYNEVASLQLDMEECVQRMILSHGFYEPEVWEALAAYATADEVFWDVGGHIGGVAIRAACDPRIKRVHCFEPNPRTAELLRANLFLNPSLAIVHHEVALGDKIETKQLNFGPPSNIGLTSFVSQPTNQSSSVDCVTVDGWISSHNATMPTLMKIDVEGFEFQVLLGASRLLESGSLKAIVLESIGEKDGRLVSEDIKRLLGKYGYTIRHLRRPSGEWGLNENFIATR